MMLPGRSLRRAGVSIAWSTSMCCQAQFQLPPPPTLTTTPPNALSLTPNRNVKRPVPPTLTDVVVTLPVAVALI